MATRLPRCFAAAAAAASASSASGSSSSRPTPPATATNTRQQAGESSRRGRREAAAPADDAAGYNTADGASWRGGAGAGTGLPSALGGPSIEAIKASLQGVLSSVRLVRVAHADAAAVAGGADGGDGAAESEPTLSPLEDGDKPEYIQRADEQVRRRRFDSMRACVSYFLTPRQGVAMHALAVIYLLDERPLFSLFTACFCFWAWMMMPAVRMCVSAVCDSPNAVGHRLRCLAHVRSMH